MNLIDKILEEWSYRSDKGYPDINNPDDLLLFESIFGFKLYEANLTPKELSKENGKTGERRINILIRKIQQQEPLKLTNGQEFLVDDSDGQLVAALEKWDISQGAVVLKNATGDTIKTSQLEKTKEFGGGSGSGGGAANTDTQESAQCLVNAVAFRVVGGKIEEKDLSRDNLIKADNFVDTTSSIQDMMSFIENDAQWRQSMILTANALLKTLGKKGFQFHRGSDFVNQIYGAWKTSKKNGNLGRIGDDKWNPADIWAVDSAAVGTEFQTKLESLNNQLLDLFDKGQLVGISLKKTSKANVAVYNREKSQSNDTYAGFDTTPNSKDVYLNFTNGARMQLRTFSGDGTSFQGELKGKEAAQGKIGGGILKNFLEKHSIGPIPDQKEALAGASTLSDEFVDRFSELFRKYTGNEIDKEDMESRSKDWLSSKYQALSVVDAIKNASNKDIKKATGDILGYAGSASSISSVYIKVS